jgi:Coenzyme PQQ synthesis protein D (PqqD)
VGEARIVLRENVSLRRTGNDALLLDTSLDRVHVLNGTAADVWELCASEPTVEELAAALASEYGLELDRARSDVESILATFRELGLLASRRLDGGSDESVARQSTTALGEAPAAPAPGQDGSS